MSVLLDRAESALEKVQSGRFSYYSDWDPNMTSDKAGALARDFAQKGVDVLIVNHHHLRWTFVEEFPVIERFTRLLADACHEHGLVVI
jgi:hypothetical protein